MLDYNQLNMLQNKKHSDERLKREIRLPFLKIEKSR